MNKLLFLVAFASLVTTSGHAEPMTRELGRGLLYIRVSSIPTDLPANLTAPAAVLDLRYARGDEAGARELRAWLGRHASVRAPIYLLANRATDAALRRLFTQRPAIVGTLLVGATAPEFTPDIPVAISPAQERRAYDAVGTAKDIAVLLVDATEKVRRDEAAVVQARLEDRTIDLGASAEASDQETPTPAAAEPLIDATLQRAVQLHRAWLVLRSRHEG